MKIKKIRAVYFSPVGNTEKVVKEAAAEMSDKLKVGVEALDFTLSVNRTDKPFVFSGNDLVIFGVPTYAGRVPNKILPFIKSMFKGNGAPAIAVVTFGNRSYGSSLTELAEVLRKSGFSVFAATAMACNHVFTDKLGYGRPDCEDFLGISRFTEYVTGKIVKATSADELVMPLIKNGEPVMPYYTPLKEDGSPANFLKAKPETDRDKCDKCGICISSCPMGSINREDPALVEGICIKCHACISKCPAGAKYFIDEDFLSHVRMLEKNFTARAENDFFA